MAIRDARAVIDALADPQTLYVFGLIIAVHGGPRLTYGVVSAIHDRLRTEPNGHERD